MTITNLTPRGIALGHLVDLYATSEVSVETRQKLCLLLLRLVGQPKATSVVEPGLAELRGALSAALPAELCDEFDRRLSNTTEPDDLWDLMGSISELLQPTLALDDGAAPIQLERSSVLGLFVRRLHLAFRTTTFEEICTLITHFGEWVGAADAADGASPPADTGLTESVHGGVGGPTASTSPSTTKIPPAYAYVLPPAQLEAHVHALARQVEDGSVSTAHPAIREQLDQLLCLAPHVPQVHYLHLLHHLHSRAFEAALESFHRYFDLLRAASAPGSTAAGAGVGGMAGMVGGGGAAVKEATRAPTQWASLNLARLQLSFCQREQAVAAIQEAVRSAQQHEDNVCLAYRCVLSSHDLPRSHLPTSPPSSHLAMSSPFHDLLNPCHEGHVGTWCCLHSLLWIYHMQSGSGADAWGCPMPELAGDEYGGAPAGAGGGGGGALSAAAGAQRQQALLQRCLSRAHEVRQLVSIDQPPSGSSHPCAALLACSPRGRWIETALRSLGCRSWRPSHHKPSRSSQSTWRRLRSTAPSP